MAELMIEKFVTEYARYRGLVEREQTLCENHRNFFLDITSKLARYQTAINRQFLEALRELESLQTGAKRKGNRVPRPRAPLTKPRNSLYKTKPGG